MTRPLTLCALSILCLSFPAFAGDVGEGHDRAGHPTRVARWARWTYDRDYVGYYVGGGAKAHAGESRCIREGVWGVDYRPVLPGFRRGVVLNWWHGRRYQDGGGTYEPDHANQPFKSFLRDTVH